MRLWHKDLISVLPRNQLLGQWRECCLIAKGLSENTLNHILVNKIKDYPIDHFIKYAGMVYDEMKERKYSCNWYSFDKYIKVDVEKMIDSLCVVDCFPFWHNERYLKQCFYNLQEKYDCGGITEYEYNIVKKFYDKNILN